MLFLFKSTPENKKRKHSEHFCRSKGPGGSQRASRTYCMRNLFFGASNQYCRRFATCPTSEWLHTYYVKRIHSTFYQTSNAIYNFYVEKITNVKITGGQNVSVFCNFDKYVLQFWQICFAILTNMFCNFDKYVLQFLQIYFTIWTNTFWNVHKYIWNALPPAENNRWSKSRRLLCVWRSSELGGKK